MHFWRLHVCGGRVRKSQAASARVILKSELGQILDQKHQLRSSPKSAKHRLIKGGVSLLLLFSVYSCGQVCVYRRPVCMGDLSLSQMFEAHGSLLSWVSHSRLLIFPETLSHVNLVLLQWRGFVTCKCRRNFIFLMSVWAQSAHCGDSCGFYEFNRAIRYIIPEIT